MYRESDFKKPHYKTGEVAEILGVTTRTIQNYDQDGRLRFTRSATNRRILPREELLAYLSSVGLLEGCDRRDVIYACADGEDAEGELDRQVLSIVASVGDLRSPVVIRDVGDSKDDGRPGFCDLLKRVREREFGRVYITSEKVLSEFGCNALRVMFEGYGVDVVSLGE